MVGTDRLDVLSSQNSAFRPVDTAFGMDGALYVSDFASRIIGHAQHPMRDPQWNHTLGRIWRVVAKDRPVVKDWPRIEGAPLPELLALLRHPQDIVREHVRIRLRGMGVEVVPALEKWVASLDRNAPDYEQALLEAVFVLQPKGEFRSEWIGALLRSKEPRMRAGAVETLRFQASHGPQVQALLSEAAKDAHPRVRMAVLNAVSHLRAETLALNPDGAENALHSSHAHAAKGVDWDQTLVGLNAQEPAVQQMLVDLKAGTRPMKGRSVPVLDINPATEVAHWLLETASAGAGSAAAPAEGDKDKPKNAPAKTWVFRTFIEASQEQSALLSVKHGYLDVSANGVQLLSADSPFSSQQQVQLELKKGLNVVEVAFRKLKSKDARPAIFIYDMVGQPLSAAKIPGDADTLKAYDERWKAEHAGDLNAIKVQAVPNLMQFSPKEIRVKAGQSVRLVFENPDLMQHNLVLVDIGSEEEVGGMADQMAAKPDAFAKNFIPESKKVLQATPLVNPNGRAELEFNAPQNPGVYPYICTFPGHWRVMRGVLIVE